MTNQPTQPTDRELLELATKAASIGPLDFDYAAREGHGMYFGPRLPMPQGVLMAACYAHWNPLEDDGDALRLAVKLQMSLDTGLGQSLAISLDGKDCLVVHDSDPYAATRRAIVRAAAEIGRNMK